MDHMTQIDDLVYALHAGTLAKQNDDDDVVLLADTEVPDPTGEFFERAAFVAAGGPENWDWSDSLAKSQRTEDRMIANRTAWYRQSFGTAAAMAGESLAKRTEVRSVGNEEWEYSYDGNELVSAKVVNGDGGELRKGIDEPVHADGTEVEKIGDAVWKYVYENNALVEMSVTDPELPGGAMCFDSDGNEKAA
jgi:hypothetical protein